MKQEVDDGPDSHEKVGGLLLFEQRPQVERCLKHVLLKCGGEQRNSGRRRECINILRFETVFSQFCCKQCGIANNIHVYT